MKKLFIVFSLLFFVVVINYSTYGDDGYRLWLKYDQITNLQKLSEYKKLIKEQVIKGNSPTIEAAKNELKIGIDGLLGGNIPVSENINEDGTLLIGNYKNFNFSLSTNIKNELMYLKIQEKEAVWWRNACVLYFQTFSKLPIPVDLEKPNKTLKYYESLSFTYAPGTW